MKTVDQVKTLEVEDILRALQIKFSLNNWTFSLYEWNKLTGWWKASNDGKFTDFSNKWRASWDRITFVEQYLQCSRYEALTWFEETFNIQNEFKPISNPIKDEWDGLSSLSQAQIDYLTDRLIDYEKVKAFVKNNWWKLALRIRDFLWTTISMQSRAITGDGWWRYYVKANTDSDWIFFEGIDQDKSSLIVVEGFTDFLSIRQYTTNVVWLLNAGNLKQLDYIKKLSEKYTIYFCPDNDESWEKTVESFNKLWIKHHLFSLDGYWVKDVNDLLKFWIEEKILNTIFNESKWPPSNLGEAKSSAMGYETMYRDNWNRLWFPSWYTAIDKYTDWFIKGKVYMIMAYSNVGKTRFAYSLVRNLIESWKKINFYSLEVDVWMLFIEMMWALNGWDRAETFDNIRDIDISKFEENLSVYDSVRSLESLEEHIRKEKPDIAIIDFVQNIEYPWNEYAKMTEIALRIQKLAILTWTTIIQLSQVSNESRFADWWDILPKGSWALFASTDVILTLWWRDNQRFLTIWKNKFWKALVNFVMDIDYAKCNFILSEDVLGESWLQWFTWLK